MSKPLSLLEYQKKRQHAPVEAGVLLFDGDWMVYNAMAASEDATDWGDGVYTLSCDHEKAWNIFKSRIDSYCSRKRAWLNAEVIIAFSGDNNWRKLLVDSNYKGNRKDNRKPVGYKEFVKRVQESDEYIAIVEPELEGDDVLGIIGSNAQAFNFKKAVLISCDKDFKTVPYCDFLHCTTGNIIKHDLQEAEFNHLFQTMKGDVVDGYKGIAGWGDKAAEWLKAPYKLQEETYEIKSGKNKGKTSTAWRKAPLDEDDTIWTAMLTLALKAGMTEQELINQARMARILRYDEYNFNTQEVKLWTPEMINYSI